MTPIFFGLLAIVLFVVLMFLGMNIPFAMLLSSAVVMIVFRTPMIAAQTIIAGMTTTFTDYSLTVAPMFGLMGFIATYTGLGSKLFDSLKTFVGHRRGGLAWSVQIASAGFGAICGSVPATQATMTAVAYPEMRKSNYSVELSSLCIAEGATLSVLIPPSATMIVFGIVTENSIGRLFMSGIIPGIVMCLLNIVLISFLCKLKPAWGPAGIRSTWAERWNSLKNGSILQVAIVFLIAMGGMWGGWFTPTEAGAIGVFGMLLVTIAAKQLNFKKLRRSLIEGVRLTAMMYLLMAAAGIFGKTLAMTRLPIAMGDLVKGNNYPPVVVMLIIIVLYFIAGMFCDFMSMMLVTIPIFYPLITDYCGYDPTYFAILIILMHSVGSMSPPVGIAIFLQKIFIAPWDADFPIGKLFGAVWPWVVMRFAAIALFSIFPGFVTFLPNLIT
ncbi:MAG: TRAP transporter large permease [Clostridiales Family XIII bacterium]|jgi:tripartite ATP-independent transporter DctM subunit|nr:TRAP transporter large permease [Clostridiales Family XIII bacterium]